MIRGIYTAASGMTAEMVRTDTTANNLANASTTGYKKDVVIDKAFSGLLLQRLNDGPAAAIGILGVGAAVDQIVTEHSAGSLRPTGNSLDVAVDGRGFFTVQTPNGLRYTRNGAFTRSRADLLTTNEGYPVMGQNGPISLRSAEGGKIAISQDGRISIDGIETEQLRLTDFVDPSRLIKEGSNLYAAGDAVQEKNITGKIAQGSVELSNVNVIAEMVNLISGYRSYEINSKAILAQDQMLDKAVNEVGKV